MKKCGFTLIELMGVIIIIAAITFLVLPNITNSLKSNEKKTNDLTLNLIENAAKLHIEDNKEYYKKIDDNKYCIKISKLVKKDYLEDKVEYNNQDITNTKSVQVTYNQGFSFELVDNEDCIGDSIGCTVVSGDGTNIGDEIECANENFYVINNNNGVISMLSKYNLNVGDNIYENDLVGIQSSKAKGFITSDNNYSTVPFSTTNYWYDENTSSLKDIYQDKFIYDSNSNLYPYIKNYETYLRERGVSSCNATLITLEQLEILGCDVLNITCQNSKYKWMYSTSYWSGTNSLIDNSSILTVYYTGSLNNLITYDDSNYGIRPVINMSVSEI